MVKRIKIVNSQTNIKHMSTEVTTVNQTIKSPETKEKFGMLFSAVYKCSLEEGKQMHEAESFSFLKELAEKGITDVTPLSARGVYLDVVRNGLSFSSASKHVYIMARSVNVNDRWEKRLVWDSTQDGKIFQCQKSRSIDRVTKPIIVYEGDTFEETLINGVAGVNYKRNPEHGTKVIAGFVYVVFPDKSREAVILYPQDIERLKQYSAKQNKKTGANALYTSAPGGQIDPGFFASKIIKFALKNIRKSGVVSEFKQDLDDADAMYATFNTPDPAPVSKQIDDAIEPEIINEPENDKQDEPF